MRKTLLILFLLIAAIGVVLVDISYWYADLKDVPPLKSGDLIFETTLTNQTLAIAFATHSPLTHVGIVHRTSDGYTVIHAAHTVTESSLADFLKGGWGERFVVMRYPTLSDAQRTAVVLAAERHIGEPYNYLFYLGGDGMYCSELPFLAYQAAGVPVGTLENIGALHVNNFAVHGLFDKRWQQHPLCQTVDGSMNAGACWNVVMQLPIITPDSLARDSHLAVVYSNYPFHWL